MCEFLGITDEIRSNIYEASLMWVGLADDNTTNSGDGDDENDNDNDNDVSIFDLACSNDDFTTLCSLVETCIDSFDADKIFTVFAPTDEAFKALDEEVGGLDTAIYSNDVSCESGRATLIKMMTGVDARIKCTNGTPYGIKGGGNDELVNFVDVDIEAADGVIHIIDGVLFIRD
ncbi:hypothetical protein FRACYDRAFT_247524 [Fragilariopsis cylindrus CCMP1102]|uniref:FAS1 domain-containing protein n=1 Tax=Fragilariopsis cylindrus CCMP1102 TaxID=635003 RepID=A0A1E7EX49_9STRA|nr:hypothetical protein FRACYDRAFT_247524 [Fragilariopsis cylindrus CCMP1102]|eukprot:OEU10427.1 hypothetical protein FRACYDRAFT_247524 [Fragilariopsis cylindrus CCMP1102]